MKKIYILKRHDDIIASFTKLPIAKKNFKKLRGTSIQECDLLTNTDKIPKGCFPFAK